VRKLTLSAIKRSTKRRISLGGNTVVNIRPVKALNDRLKAAVSPEARKQIRTEASPKDFTRNVSFEYVKGGRRCSVPGGALADWPSLEAIETWGLEQRNLRIRQTDPQAAHRQHQADERAKAAAERAEIAKAMTFKQAAAEYMSLHQSEWQGDATVWPQTLTQYAYDIIGSLPVQSIEVAHVVNLLTRDIKGVPFWNKHQTTAMRTRGRIEAVLDYAKVKLKFAWIDGGNPARWDGNLEHMLSALKGKKPREALPYVLAPAFMKELAPRDDMLSLTLNLYIRSVTRSWDPIDARVRDIDRKAMLWTIPPSKRKGDNAHLEHIVPLTKEMLRVIDKAGSKAPDALLFPQGNQLTAQIRINKLCKEIAEKIGHDKPVTAHGMRSMFKDWAGDCTSADNETSEFCLAHVKKGVEKAYRRATAVEKRRVLMGLWNNYLDGDAVGDVVAFGKKAAS
jgi:integrase